MSPKGYFSYVRVSTQRQGASGTSLGEQRSAIERYAQRFNLQITKEFEERETAAKHGRPVFLEMLRELKGGKARGIIIHKIDRSARNLRDWADLGSLIDHGAEVHFVNESIDLTSRGGRLSADIQAVVASDYIRNLREETKKGIYGRLKQGLYPFPAPIGYLDVGPGKPKKPDPVKAPLVKSIFKLYASGNFGLNSLVERTHEIGLTNQSRRKISRNGLACLLKNPFYMGLIRIKKVGEVFVGVHKPIISKQLFDDVQATFAGKRKRRMHKHSYLFSRLIKCKLCGRSLIAEKQKGRVYYRCHVRECPQKSIREDIIEERLIDLYRKVRISKAEFELLRSEAVKYQENAPKLAERERKQLQLEEAKIEPRLARLADAYVDEVFDKDTYLAKKNELIFKRKDLNEKLKELEYNKAIDMDAFEKFLELLKSAYSSYKKATDGQKREMIKITTSNLFAEGKSLKIKLEKPFQIVADRLLVPSGVPRRAATRTLSALLKQLLKFFMK